MANRMVRYETERLILRQWEDKDIIPFAAMNADQLVMEYFPKTLTVDETVTMVTKISDKIAVNGFGFYACELKSTREFIGFVGLNIPDFNADFTPCVEIGWRLARKFWGNGYAKEAALKCLSSGFTDFGLNEIVSFTAKQNQRSWQLMKRIGMEYSGEFYHPKLATDHWLNPLVLYRINKARFFARNLLK